MSIHFKLLYFKVVNSVIVLVIIMYYNLCMFGEIDVTAHCEVRNTVSADESLTVY